MSNPATAEETAAMNQWEKGAVGKIVAYPENS
jgi:hypothetical protein